MYSMSSILVAICLAVAPMVIATTYPRYDMGQVCNGQVKQLVALDQVMSLSVKSDWSRISNCPGKAEAAGLLQDVVAMNKNSSICSRAVGTKLLTLNNKHTHLNLNKPLPYVLQYFQRDFSYGLIANCKLSFRDNAHLLDKKLKESILSPLKYLEAAGVFLLNDYIDLEHSDIIRLTYKLMRLAFYGLTSLNNHDKDIQGETLKALRDFNYMCARVYKPLLDEMLGTITDLMFIGYDYNMGVYLTGSEKYKFNKDPSVRRWLNVYLMCSFMNDSPSFATKAQPDKVLPQIISKKMPDMLQVTTNDDRKEITTLNKKGEAEIEHIIDDIYKRLNGDKISIGDKIMRSGSKFWLNYLKFIDYKITSDTSGSTLRGKGGISSRG